MRRASDHGQPPPGPLIDQSGAVVERRFLDLVGMIPAIVWEADGEQYQMTFISERCRDLLGYEPSEWLTRPRFWEDHLHPDDRDAAIAASDAAIRGLGETQLDYRFRAADGSYLWFHDAIQVVRNLDGRLRLVGVMVDVTQRKALEERLAHAASHDALTGLRNRADVLEATRRLLETEPASGLALLFLDLDGFKAVNDRLGHAAGDQVLRVVARRLERTVRQRDLVGRLGGDEFVVVVPAATPAVAEALAVRIRRRVREPIVVDGERVVVRASTGLAFAEPGMGVDALLNAADEAMYAAKAQARPRTGATGSS